MRVALAVILVALGLGLCAIGIVLETRNPRTNDDDTRAWCVLATGTFLTSSGATLPFVPYWLAVVIGILSPCFVFAWIAMLYWIIVILTSILR